MRYFLSQKGRFESQFLAKSRAKSLENTQVGGVSPGVTWGQGTQNKFFQVILFHVVLRRTSSPFPSEVQSLIVCDLDWLSAIKRNCIGK